MKKTLFNKFIALICVAIASILFVGTFGCGANDDNPVINTGKYIVDRAKTDYRIIIAKQADEKERLAARELQTFFFEATNCRLNIVDDENVTFDENAKYYSVGRNNFQKTSGVDADAKELKAQGYRIKTKGNSVFLIGGDSYGTLYSVYGYLGLEFDYDYFFTDVYCINKNVNDLELKNYDVTKSPDIDVMAGPNVGFVIYNTVNANRFGSMATTEWNIPAENYYGVHNVFAITPKDRFDDETNHPETYHPEWFADNGTQVCFTAHGDKDGYSALKARYLEVIKNGIKKINDSGLSEEEKTAFIKRVKGVKLTPLYVTVSNASAYYSTDSQKRLEIVKEFVETCEYVNFTMLNESEAVSDLRAKYGI